MLLETITGPGDLRELDEAQLEQLAGEIRAFIVQSVSVTGGHLGSNLGVVELSLALHRVFDSPKDLLLWDTGHQAYVHKILTGRRERFSSLRQANGLSGYPSRNESPHDWVENSHASTILGYAHGLAMAMDLQHESDRRVVAVIGDGSMTGGMAYEALNNLGHSGRRVVIVLNDNGRSYAPTVSRLAAGLTRLRLNPSYVKSRDRIQRMLRGVPGIGEHLELGLEGMRAASREVLGSGGFFEALGVRYVGPIDGHDIPLLEHTLRRAAELDDGPILVHVLTQKGRGYKPAEDDDEKCLHDTPVFDPITGPPPSMPAGYTQAFADAIVAAGAANPDIVAISAAMVGPVGLIPFQTRHPDRLLDVGIAEQHAVTAAAGMAMAGLRPVVAIYSTFLTRAFDQVNLDVGLHKLPVVFAIDRAGITGDDGPSHHGVLDMALLSKVPGITLFAPSSAQEVEVMLTEALSITDGPSAVRYPKGPARQVPPDEVGSGRKARLLQRGDDVCILAVGKMVEAAEEATRVLEQQGVSATLWDVRVVKPLDPVMIADAANHPLVVTVEDGVREGGAGTAIADAVGATSEGRPSPAVVVLGVPDRYIPQASPAAILASLGLDGPGIAASVIGVLEAADAVTEHN
ncbi:MAG TPA: 1-deoxy-D-xylulose-5-phosphate synthase [Acidimicrobiales bacterium]|nr:1-deoxy-D-xylulose-5-phosphate synthase [Acidimicrobiales bacterium]